MRHRSNIAGAWSASLQRLASAGGRWCLALECFPARNEPSPRTPGLLPAGHVCTPAVLPTLRSAVQACCRCCPSPLHLSAHIPGLGASWEVPNENACGGGLRRILAPAGPQRQVQAQREVGREHGQPEHRGTWLGTGPQLPQRHSNLHPYLHPCRRSCTLVPHWGVHAPLPLARPQLPTLRTPTSAPCRGGVILPRA